ncbi:MAG: IS607 family transposase [Stigonema ocellatum SAG 48.90 = DSM 106950]|nr:IS607 family transposase [Stigonema ocellatum SAG 48.90 = DSM 106950]
MSKYLTIAQAAKIKGVSTDTLRRWEREGKIQSIRTDGGHRRYLASDLMTIEESESRLTLCYARVSTKERKDDLETQASVLQGYSEAQGWKNIQVIKDLGSSMNHKKRGLNRLIELIETDKVERLVLTHKDRLLRFGAELIFTLCEIHGVTVTMINRKEDSTFEEDLVQDVLEIITVFSARLYGSRSKKNLKLMEKLLEISATEFQDPVY